MKKKRKMIDREVFVQSGKKGGVATAKRGKKFYKEIGVLGAKVRWTKKKPLIEEVSKTEDGLEKAEMV